MTPSVLVTSRPLRTPSRLPHHKHGSAHDGIHAPCRKPVAAHIHGRLARPGRPTKPYQVRTTSCVLPFRQTGKAACLPADYLLAPQYAFHSLFLSLEASSTLPLCHRLEHHFRSTQVPQTSPAYIPT
eukprot:365246-Chlamydomonas_euryale.AAC.11